MPCSPATQMRGRLFISLGGFVLGGLAFLACGASVAALDAASDSGTSTPMTGVTDAFEDAYDTTTHGDGTTDGDASSGGEETSDARDANDGMGEESFDSPWQGAGIGDCGMTDDAAMDDVRITDALVDVEYVDAGVVTCLPPVQQAVCPTLCGNGVRDACRDGGPDSGSSTEECDGTDLAGATCGSLGYAGGSLACDATCHFDISQCETYSPTVLDVADRDAASGDAWPVAPWPAGGTLGPLAWGVGLAASATELGLAWIERDAACSGIRFDRYRSDMTRIGESACLGSCDASAVSVAATPSGWMLAISTSHGLDLLPIDAQGNASGSVRTIAQAYVQGGAANPPTLTSRVLADSVLGGPLLTWGDDSGHVFASLLRDDGTQEQPTARVFSEMVAYNDLYRIGAVFIGNGFLIGGRETSTGFDGVVLRTLRLDGSLSVSHRPFPCWNTEFPRLAWTGSEARITVGRFDSLGGVYWARLDANGIPLAPAQPVPFESAYAPAPVVSVGGDTLMLVEVPPNGSTNGTSTPSGYYSVRVAGDGAVTTVQLSSTDVSNFSNETFPDLAVQGTAAFTAGAFPASTQYPFVYSAGGIPIQPGFRTVLAKIH